MKNILFKLIHTNKLVYNQCWEDPRVDRQLLDIQKDSQIAMITSAGCNALDYLLDNPKKIFCVDINPKQNALLELKKQIIENQHYEVLQEFFQHGKYKLAEKYYKNELRAKLPQYAVDYWDKHIEYFSGEGLRKSFYFRGSSGFLAWTIRNFLKLHNDLVGPLRDIWSANNLIEQEFHWKKIEKKLSKLISNEAFRYTFIQNLAGVPDEQIQLIELYPGKKSVTNYIHAVLRKVFVEVPISDNYFWHVYFFGKYNDQCRPNYLDLENFKILHDEVDKIKIKNATFSKFLQKSDKIFSHFVLLDHQDWLVRQDNVELEREWRLILEHSRPGTKFLMRSSGNCRDILPNFVKEKIQVLDKDVNKVNHLDRVGTYATTLLAVLK